MSKFYGEEYCTIGWRAEDVITKKPNWSIEKCEEWLEDNERRIQDRLTELGWEVLDSLLMMEDDNDE